MIDLRSDTVTRPTAAMRKAMADAEVGDDVYGEDPTVIRLQERIAGLLGKEAALFVPSGTMANQVALAAATRHGDEVIIGVGAHCWRYESGALAALAGCQTQVIGTDGTFTAADVRAAYKPEDPYGAATRVVAVENTHNAMGGIVWERAKLAEVTSAAHGLGMWTHLDGARIWNAAVATGASEKELADGFDSVSVCLSKGLGAPAGSVIAGPRDFIKKCHRLRKMYGGGMRQSGILAAAGLVALRDMRDRLAEDHVRARRIAERLASMGGFAVDLAAVQTNIVFVRLEKLDPARVVEAAAKDGILLYATGPQQIRFVTHHGVDDEDVARLLEFLTKQALGSRP
jgi:threonine aldolase